MPDQIFLGYRITSYNVCYTKLLRAVDRAVTLCGGMETFVRPGQRVLLKPNMLSAAPLAQRVTTDPSVVRAVGKLVLKAGGRIVIGDSPAIDKVSRISKVIGMKEVAAELGADLIEFCRPTLAKTPQGAIYHALELEETALTADVVINLPVITSYSIHYTKLYDFVRRLPPSTAPKGVFSGL